jgi:hypothetical protein
MVECYIRMVEEHLQKIVTSRQRDWDSRLPIFLLAYRAPTHDTMGLTLASLVFGRELLTALGPAVWDTPHKERPTVDHVANLMDHLHDIHSYARQHLKLANDQMKTRNDRLANCIGYHEGDKVWLCHSIHTKGNGEEEGYQTSSVPFLD